MSAGLRRIFAIAALAPGVAAGVHSGVSRAVAAEPLKLRFTLDWKFSSAAM
jgi:hypothetical protein